MDSPRLAGEIADAITVKDLLWSRLRTDTPILVILFLELSFGYWLFFMPRLTARLWMRWSDAGRSGAPTGNQDPPAGPA